MTQKTNTTSIFTPEDDEFLTPLLGPSTNCQEHSGVIRPGIMVLKKGTTENDKEIYDKLLTAGKTFDEIDKALGLGSDEKSKLKPLNVDYFTVRSNDCINPAHAKKLMEYADKDDKLRSFPVWFPINEWWELIPHSLKCYGSAGLKHRSNFIPVRENGKIVDMKMVCETPQECDPGKRIFGGRSWIQKDCDPVACDLYQSQDCKLRGTIQCMIPGLPGIGTWAIPTTSFYSLNRIKNTLRRVHKATGGRIANIIMKGDTIFFLRKVMAKISTIDTRTGQPKLREQYLVSLEVTVDLFELAKMYETRNVLARGSAAAAMLGTGNIYNMEEHRNRQEEQSVTDRSEKSLQEKTSVTGKADKTTQGEKTPEKKAPEKTEESPTAKAETDKSAKQKSTSSNKSDKNGDGPLQNQLDAIDKLAKKYQIPNDLLMEEKKKLRTQEDAGALIRQLNKGDLSRFLPAA